MPPQLALVRLLRHVTEDGLWEVDRTLPLGRVYVVDLTTRQVGSFWSVVARRAHDKELVRSQDGTWFPVELLSIDEGLGQA